MNADLITVYAPGPFNKANTDLHTHQLPTRQAAYTLYHNKMCPLNRSVLDKNSEAESHSHTLTYYIFLWIIERTLHMILK